MTSALGLSSLEGGGPHLQNGAEGGVEQLGGLCEGQGGVRSLPRGDGSHSQGLHAGGQAEGVFVELDHEAVQGLLRAVGERQLVHCTRARSQGQVSGLVLGRELDKHVQGLGSEQNPQCLEPYLA